MRHSFFRSLLATSLLLAAAPSLTTAGTTNSPSFSPVQTAQIEQIVHDYLLSHPEVLVEAGQHLRMQESASIEVKARTLILQQAAALFQPTQSVVLGNPTGAVTLIEFYDYQCPHCQRVANQLVTLLANNPNLRLLLYPLPMVSPASEKIAIFALAAYSVDPVAFLKLHEALFTISDKERREALLELAEECGYNRKMLKKAMNNPNYKAIIEANKQIATALLQPSLGTLAAPVTIIGFSNTTSTSNPESIAFFAGEISIDQLQARIDYLQQLPQSSDR